MTPLEQISKHIRTSRRRLGLLMIHQERGARLKNGIREVFHVREYFMLVYY
jgi:hypothetical protein